MRKTFIFIVLLFLTITLVQLNNFSLVEGKIVYEFANGTSDLSVSEVKESLSGSGKVNIVTRFQYDTFKVDNNLPDDATMEEVDEYKKMVFEKGKKYHKALNEQYSASLDMMNYESRYIAEYLPYVEYVFDEEEFTNNAESILAQLSSNKNVQKVFVKENNSNKKDSIEYGLYQTEADELLESNAVSGRGIKVGMIETGYPDFSHVNLDSVSHTIFDLGTTVTATEHATTVASIICGETGIAQGASLYCTGIYGNSIVSEMDWLINRGVDVVNMSYGEADPQSVYGADSAIADYMVLTYNIVACAAVGNTGEGNGKIGTPAMGYNVISVGSIDYTNGVSGFSSYNNLSLAEKPTICAPGEGLNIDNFDTNVSGTSFSCAFTTGLIALLLNKYPTLKTKAMQVVAMVVSNAKIGSAYPFNTPNGFNEYMGAGIINFDNMYDNYYKIYTIDNINNSLRKVYEWDIYISGDQTIRACFAWGAYANTSNNSAVFTNYDVYIKDSNGNTLAMITDSTNNVEYATAYVAQTGRYYIQLYQSGYFPSGQSGDLIYFSYRYR